MKKLICILIVSLYSCAGPDRYGLGEFDNINTSDAIKFMFNEQALQVKKVGISARLNYLSHALESFYIPPNHKTEIGSDSLKKLYFSWDKQNKIIDYKLNDIQVYPINMVAASYHYQTEIVFLDSSKTQRAIKQLESGMVIKIENDWRYLNYQVAE